LCLGTIGSAGTARTAGKGSITMHAGLVTGQRRFELVEMDEPTARPGTALVEVTLCGICGTDLHGFLGADPYNPAICGHEWVGNVLAVGDGVKRLNEGDRVVAAIAAPCGTCAQCRAGRTNYCSAAFIGMVGRDRLAPPHGGFAPRISLAGDRLFPVTGGLSDVQAAIVEPTTVALHAVRRTPPQIGDTVIIQGCGPIGLLTLQCARAHGAGEVIAVEPNAHRRAIALDVGATAALSPEEARDRFARAGADIVFECAGVSPTVQSAVDLCRQGGVVNLVGLASGTATISPGDWLRREITVVASLGYLHHEFAMVMDLLASGAVRVEPLHDRTISLAELPEVIEQLADDPSTALKVLVNPAD
jgi:(R,R)-butanediol dehydrogenase / meso-butanediol dehydrogenase / diacetyl reductase